MAQGQPEEPLIFNGPPGRARIRCPWCEVWEPEEAFIELQTPPNYSRQCGTILKHGGVDGCKRLFTIEAYRRPARAV